MISTKSGPRFNLIVSWKLKVEQREVNQMLVVAAVLFLTWVLAIVSHTTMGGFVHVLLAGAIGLTFARAVQAWRNHQRIAARS